MDAKVTQLFPAQKGNSKRLASRLARMERLLKKACILLAESEQGIVVWPKELADWYEVNVPNKPMTFDEAIDELTEEQITALGLWADEGDDDAA